MKLNWIVGAALIALQAMPAFAAALPDTGTYFITSSDNDEALTPNGPTPGQNVFLREFNHGGAQKWKITRKLDANNKPTNRYTLQVASEDNLNLQPFPAGDHTAMVSTPDKPVFVLEPGDGGILIKQKNGDALHTVTAAPGPTEAHFGPSDGSKKYLWNFVPAN